MTRARAAALVLMAVTLSGCGVISGFTRGEDNSIPPTPLAEFDAEVNPSIAWQVDVGDGPGDRYATLEPASDGLRVYVADYAGQVAAVDIDTGNTAWRSDLDVELTGGTGLGEGLVVVGDNDGNVIALDAAEGSERWRTRVSSEVLAAPVAGNGIVVVRSADGRFSAFNAADGEPAWAYNASVPALSLRGSGSPIIVQGVVISGMDNGRLLALELTTGRVIFDRAIASPRGRNDLERMVDIDVPPVLIGPMLYIAAYQGNITALDMRDGSLRWTRDFSAYGGLTADQEQVYVADEDDVVWALDARTGAPMWRQEALRGRRLAGPALHEGRVAVADFEGYVHWLEPASGRLVGRTRGGSAGVRSMPWSLKGNLMVLGNDGVIRAFRLSN